MKPCNSLKDAYQASQKISDTIWLIVQFWTNFNKTIIGKNYINSLDFLSLNLAKAISTKSRKQKSAYLLKSQEQLKNALLWHDKARRRKLINQKDYKKTYNQLQEIKDFLNQLG